MEFEPDLMEYLRSIYTNCCLCAQNCIHSWWEGRLSPKISLSLVKICALRGCALEPWEAVGLHFRMRGKRAECYWGQQMMWTEGCADSPDCPWDQRMSFLQTHPAFATGILGELPLKAHVLILEVALTWKETVTGWRVGQGVQVGFCLHHMGRRAWGSWSSESPGQQLRRGLGLWQRVV